MIDEFDDDDYVDVDPNAYLNNSTYTKLPLEDADQSLDVNDGPHGNEKYDRVFCLSCHFPHASRYADALRWDNTVALSDGQGCQQCHNK